MPEVTTLLFGRKAAKIGEIQLDVTIREVPTYDSEITRFPVESGYDINDNIRKLPEKLEIDGIVTNTPLVVVFQDVTEQIKQDANGTEIRSNERVGHPTYVEVAQNAMLDLAGRRIQSLGDGIPKIFDIITGLRVYTNMAIESLSFPRESTTGQALRIRATFIQVEVINTETIAIPDPQTPFTDKTQSSVSKGNQTGSKSTTEESNLVSIAKRAFNAITR